MPTSSSCHRNGTAAEEPAERPPVSLNGADWGSSNAKHLIVQDMMDGLVPYDKPIRNVRHLYDQMYAHQPEFRDFPFNQERYKARIGRIQKAVKRLKWASEYDDKCLKEARQVFPQQTHGPTGVTLWEDSEADKYLEIDMADGKHLQMKCATRECYQLFSVRRFSKRIDQKREASKPYGLNPMQAAAKREAKQKSKVKNRPIVSQIGSISVYDETS